jgi:hypothetical protein
MLPGTRADLPGLRRVAVVRDLQAVVRQPVRICHPPASPPPASLPPPGSYQHLASRQLPVSPPPGSYLLAS